MKRKHLFGELEMAVLEVIRQQGRCTVHQVVDALGGTRKYTTIMTVMSRLASKGTLKRSRAGRQFEYWLAPRKQGPLHRLLKGAFQGKSSALVAHLIDTEEISRAELKEMERLIKQAKER